MTPRSRSQSAGQILISLEDTKARAEVQSLQGQLWDAMAREDGCRRNSTGTSGVFSGQVGDDAERESVSRGRACGPAKHLRNAPAGISIAGSGKSEKESQVEKEIEGLRAQESAASRRIEIVREEAATVAILVNKGLERRPRLLNLERETADIEGRRGEIVAQISRAEQVIDESQVTLLKLESDRQNEIAQSIREAQNQIFQIRERLQGAEDQFLRTAVKAPEDGVVTELRIRTSVA